MVRHHYQWWLCHSLPCLPPALLGPLVHCQIVFASRLTFQHSAVDWLPGIDLVCICPAVFMSDLIITIVLCSCQKVFCLCVFWFLSACRCVVFHGLSLPCSNWSLILSYSRQSFCMLPLDLSASLLVHRLQTLLPLNLQLVCPLGLMETHSLATQETRFESFLNILRLRLWILTFADFCKIKRERD